jgi:hypothetical protein
MLRPPASYSPSRKSPILRNPRDDRERGATRA